MARFGPFVAMAIMVLAAGIDLAQAGSQSWMSGVVLQAPPPVRRIALNARGHADEKQAVISDVAASSNTTSHDTALNRRYLVPSRNHIDLQLPWPRGEILYCYATPEAEAALDAPLRTAKQLWLDALGEPFKMEQLEGVSSGPACTGHKDRKHILVVSLTAGTLASTVGYAPERKPATMKLTTSTSVGALNVITNIAHEIGHIWGLRHEHQDPLYWSGTVHSLWPGDQDPAEAPFQIGQFQCQNLIDYALKAAEAMARGIDPVTEMCRDINVASDLEFSAKDYLPHVKWDVTSQAEPDSDDEEEELVDKRSAVDWKSIMIYPSTSGGIGNAGAPEDGEVDMRLEVLRAWKDNLDRVGAEDYVEDEDDVVRFRRISSNNIPSERDIEGMKKGIYDDVDENDTGGYTDHLLLSKEHLDHQKFIEEARKRMCGEVENPPKQEE